MIGARQVGSLARSCNIVGCICAVIPTEVVLDGLQFGRPIARTFDEGKQRTARSGGFLMFSVHSDLVHRHFGSYLIKSWFYRPGLVTESLVKVPGR